MNNKLPQINLVFNRRKTASPTVKASVDIRVCHDYKQKFISTGVRLYSNQWKNGKIVNCPDIIQISQTHCWVSTELCDCSMVPVSVLLSAMKSTKVRMPIIHMWWAKPAGKWMPCSCLHPEFFYVCLLYICFVCIYVSSEKHILHTGRFCCTRLLEGVTIHGV